MSPAVIAVMGVSGAGKTTIGQIIAARLGWPFQDADALHPRANLLKMAAGHDLTDADRAPWLAALASWVRATRAAGQTGVLACSLLKRAYRDQVIGHDPAVALVYLHGSADLLRSRMIARQDHFMPPSLLASQLATLEPPAPSEQAISIAVHGDPDQAARTALAALGLPVRPAPPPNM